MLNPTSLYYFTLVVKHNGYTAAEHAMDIPKSKLSRHVQALEREIGVELIRREKKQIVVTDMGRVLFDNAQRGFDHLQNAVNACEIDQQSPTGKVYIAVPTFIANTYFPEIISQLKARFPNISLVLDASNREVDLYQDKYDMAIRVRTSKSDSWQYVVKSLVQVHHKIVATPACIAREGRPKHFFDMQDKASICYPRDAFEEYGQWAIPQKHSELKVRHQPQFISNEISMHFAAYMQGIGYAYLPDVITKHAFASGMLEEVLPELGTYSQEIQLIYTKPTLMRPAVRSVLGFIDAHFASHLQQTAPSLPSTIE
jgi:DNA-binding transcriptional LysR family regulator